MSAWAPVLSSYNRNFLDWSPTHLTQMLRKTYLTLTRSSKGASIHNLVWSSPPKMVAHGRRLSHHLLGKLVYLSTLQCFEYTQVNLTCALYLQLLFQGKLIGVVVCRLDLQ
jgi:hypothetical protein